MHFFALRTFSQSFENPFQARYVLLRLLQMFFKARAQGLGARCLGHLRDGFHQLVFRAVEILQFLHIKMFQAIHFHLILLSK